MVAQLDDLVDVGRMCAAATDETRFPLLAGIDPVDETIFNRRQTRRVAAELKLLRDEPDPVRAAANAVLRLTTLIDARSTRRLVFVGD